MIRNGLGARFHQLEGERMFKKMLPSNTVDPFQMARSVRRMRRATVHRESLQWF